MVTSMQDIADVYAKRDGISCTDTATARREQRALLERELYDAAKDNPAVATYLDQFNYGIMQWEEMLLRLSIYLAKQNQALFDDLVKTRELSVQPMILPDGRMYIPLKDEKGE